MMDYIDEQALVQQEVEPDPHKNGATNPGGMNHAIGIEKDTGSGYAASELAFMTAHVDDMRRLLAESVLTAEDIDNLVHQDATEQASFGRIDVTRLLKLRFGGSQGKDGRGRKDGVQVATMSAGGMMAKAKGFWGKLMGGGGSADVPPEVNGAFNR